MSPDIENEFREGFVIAADRLHELRRARNGVLHSASIELKADGEFQGMMKSSAKLGTDPETGDPIFDQELLSEGSFEKEFELMGPLAVFLSRCHTQLIHRLPNASPTPPGAPHLAT